MPNVLDLPCRISIDPESGKFTKKPSEEYADWRRLAEDSLQLALDALHQVSPPQFEDTCERALRLLQLNYRLVLPLSGRRKWFPRIRQWFAEQTWPQISLLVIDASPDVTFRREVRDWLAGMPCETTYLPLQSTGELPDRERRYQPETVRAVQRAMPRLYNPAVRRLSQELVFWLEDDILPPVDAIERLARSMDAHVAAVSGAVPSRFEPRVIAWRTPTLETIRAYGAGVETIHGSGFGCLLVRRSFLQAHPLHCGGRSKNYDQEIAFDAYRDELEWRIDWSVQCAHQDIPAGELLASA